MINFLKNAPQGLKTFDELFRYATNLYKQQTGVFPEGIDKFTIRRQAANLAEERGKVVDLPTSNIKNLEKTGPTVDLSKYTNKDLNKLAEEGDRLQADLSLVDEDGASTLPFREFQEKSARLKEINEIIRAAQESKLPDSYFDRPRDEGGIPTTIEGKTKNMSAEEIMDFLMNKGKGKDTNIGTAPKTKKTKPKVDPELQAMDDQNEMFKDFSKRIKDMSPTERVAERLKDLKGVDLSELSGIDAQKIASEVIGRKGPFKTISNKGAKEVLGELEPIIKRADAESDLGTKLKNFDGDPDAMAKGGRIGFSSGAGVAGDQMEGDQYVISDIPGSPQVPMGQFGPLNVGIFGGGSYGKNEIIPGVDMATTDQNYGIVGQFPIGNTGFSIGGDYMKSRVNERFTGGNNQVFKTVPTDSDRFNFGISFKKPLSGGRFGLKEGGPPNPGRRNFMKLMAGLASLPVIGKLFKGAKVAEKVVQLKNTTTTMPAWFPQFVEKFISKGVGKKIDQDLMEFTNPDLPNIKVTKADDGRVFVEGQNDYSKNYEIDYTPPGYEVVNEKTGKAVKTKGDFMAQEEVPVNVDPDGNADFDAEVLEDIDQLLTSDARAMEEFATGKKIKEMKRGEISVGRAEAKADAARKGEDFAKGGLAYMLGE